MKYIKRIGLIVPGSNTTIESDFRLVLPQNITVHSTRICTPPGIESEEIVDIFNSKVEDAAKCLAKSKIDIISYGFTTGSFYRGIDYNNQLIEKIEKVSGLKAITPSTAILKALNKLNAKNVSIVTPYPEWNNKMFLNYLEDTDYNVLKLEGDKRSAEEAIKSPMWHQEPESILEFILNIDHSGADVLLCPCTAWRTVEIIEILERELKIPVITANQASMWEVLSTLGFQKSIKGYGRLLELA